MATKKSGNKPQQSIGLQQLQPAAALTTPIRGDAEMQRAFSRYEQAIHALGEARQVVWDALRGGGGGGMQVAAATSAAMPTKKPARKQSRSQQKRKTNNSTSE